jgi:hypothetical protein
MAGALDLKGEALNQTQHAIAAAELRVCSACDFSIDVAWMLKVGFCVSAYGEDGSRRAQALLHNRVLTRRVFCGMPQAGWPVHDIVG